MLTNEGFFNNGSATEGGDPGRQMVTGRTGDAGKFKVPGLRNVEASAPYMHDGSLATLEDVVDHYDRGGNGHPAPIPRSSRWRFRPAEKADLLAFLRALTDEAFLADSALPAVRRGHWRLHGTPRIECRGGAWGLSLALSMEWRGQTITWVLSSASPR